MPWSSEKSFSFKSFAHPLNSEILASPFQLQLLSPASLSNYEASPPKEKRGLTQGHKSWLTAAITVTTQMWVSTDTGWWQHFSLHFVERKYRVIKDSPTDRKFNFCFKTKLRSVIVSVHLCACQSFIFLIMFSSHFHMYRFTRFGCTCCTLLLQAHSLASNKCCTYF